MLCTGDAVTSIYGHHAQPKKSVGVAITGVEIATTLPRQKDSSVNVNRSVQVKSGREALEREILQKADADLLRMVQVFESRCMDIARKMEKDREKAMELDFGKYREHMHHMVEENEGHMQHMMHEFSAQIEKDREKAMELDFGKYRERMKQMVEENEGHMQHMMHEFSVQMQEYVQEVKRTYHEHTQEMVQKSNRTKVAETEDTSEESSTSGESETETEKAPVEKKKSGNAPETKKPSEKEKAQVEKKKSGNALREQRPVEKSESETEKPSDTEKAQVEPKKGGYALRERRPVRRTNQNMTVNIEEEICGWGSDVSDEALEKIACHGLHEAVHHNIICMQELQAPTHEDLDDIWVSMANMCLDGPTKTDMPDPCDRQAALVQIMIVLHDQVSSEAIRLKVSPDTLYVVVIEENRKKLMR